MTENEQKERTSQCFNCYLLVSRSEMPHFKGRTYIGFTVDPVRRLKQHNSGVKSGGARKTNNRGPWDMVLLVSGFPNEISALRFEWSWQHPQESRRLQAFSLKKGYREKLCQYRLRVLSHMINTGPWDRLALTMSWLREDYRLEFATDFHQPSHIPVKIGISKSLPKSNPNEADPSNETVATITECFLCNSTILNEDKVCCLNNSCSISYHIECLAKTFLQHEPLYIMPRKGKCPKCDTSLLWGDLIRPLSVNFKRQKSGTKL